MEFTKEQQEWIDMYYMPVPKDANGVPIHVGESLELPSDYTGDWNVEKLTFDGCEWYFESEKGYMNCSGWLHVKPDPLKELLHDACMNATRIRCVQGVGTDISIEVDETELASYADRIRELMEVDR